MGLRDHRLNGSTRRAGRSVEREPEGERAGDLDHDAIDLEVDLSFHPEVGRRAGFHVVEEGSAGAVWAVLAFCARVLRSERRLVCCASSRGALLAGDRIDLSGTFLSVNAAYNILSLFKNMHDVTSLDVSDNRTSARLGGV